MRSTSLTTTRSRLRSRSLTPNTVTLPMSRLTPPRCLHSSRLRGFRLDSSSTRVAWLYPVRGKNGKSPPSLPTSYPGCLPSSFKPFCIVLLVVVLSCEILKISGVNGAMLHPLASASSPVLLSTTLLLTALSGLSLVVRVMASAAWRVRRELVSGLRSTPRCWWRTRTQASPSNSAVQEVQWARH